MGQKKAIFLDRDGVLNDVIVKNGRPYTPPLEKIRLLDGIKDSIRILKKHGFLLFVVTNQPDVGKGLISKEEVDQLHLKLFSKDDFDEILVCTHVDEDDCKCRKPRPGMVFELQQKWGVKLADSYVVGDRWRDIEMAKNAGCTSVLIGDGYQEKKVFPDYQFKNLLEFAENIEQIESAR